MSPEFEIAFRQIAEAGAVQGLSSYAHVDGMVDALRFLTTPGEVLRGVVPLDRFQTFPPQNFAVITDRAIHHLVKKSFRSRYRSWTHDLKDGRRVQMLSPLYGNRQNVEIAICDAAGARVKTFVVGWVSHVPNAPMSELNRIALKTFETDARRAVNLTR